VAGSQCTQAALKFPVLLFQPPEYWDYRSIQPHPAISFLFKAKEYSIVCTNTQFTIGVTSYLSSSIESILNPNAFNTPKVTNFIA
jgi:hypothetical protein